MPRVLETTVYTFEELSTSAKDKAREWMREVEGRDWTAEYEPYETAAKILGIDLVEWGTKRHSTNKNEMTRYQTTTIQYTGFWSQGDGASFTGTYKFIPGCAQKIREEFGTDTELHSIADALQVFQCRMVLDGKRGWEGKIERGNRSGNYVHSGTMDATISDADGEEMDVKLSDEFRDIMRRFADWIYKGLEEDYDSRMEDEAIDETITRQRIRIHRGRGKNLMLVFDSSTPQDTLKDVAEYLRQLADNHEKSTARTKTAKALNTARANVLLRAAMDLEGAGIVPKRLSFPVPHQFEAGDMHPDTCTVCGKYERYEKFHKLPADTFTRV